ncbi:CehA/McbA family metallohydrolase [Sciscionella sediminilitoris]|uniref:CehA/McbA family metallohydrolase n=1 Tax=Sciscionella sediminilitoris TaxID=1445613 RepID=UPI0004DF5995|nr:CehA/McbA family metallohydrolase [Sciscionella sp. SE31]
MDRRTLLLTTGTAAAAFLPTLSFAANGQQGRDSAKTIDGRFDPGAPDWYYLPVEVPEGANRIEVGYSYDKPQAPAGQYGNACDIGIFGPEGEFRGYSGGAREQFVIRAGDATPGYIPGPITPGLWHVCLGPYTVAPQGMRYRVTVTIGFGEPGEPRRPVPAPLTAPARDRGPSWYCGDNHLHTVYSDGKRTLDQLVADARAAGLDFITSTEHNTHSAQLVLGEHARGDLLMLNGEEVTTRSGHWPAIGLPAGTWIDWRYRAGDPGAFAKFTRQVHAAGGLVIAAHPFADCFGCTYEFSYELADLVEVWNGPWTPDDEAAVTTWDGLLRTGRFIPAIGDSDAHKPTDVVGLPQTVVRAASLRRADLLAGLHGGHSWLAESAKVGLRFTAATANARAEIGERLRAGPGDQVRVELEVDGVPGCTTRVLSQLGPVATGTGPLSWETRPRYTKWVRAEVRRGSAMVALTNPIFIGPR